jgi:hypothetical protein
MFMAGDDEIPINNGAILNTLQIIKSVMSSAAEAELCTLFINAKTAISMRTTLPANANTDANRQLHSTRTTHQQNPPKGAQSY